MKHFFLKVLSKSLKQILQIVHLCNFRFGIFQVNLIFFDKTFDADAIFGSCGALVFIIDAQDDYSDALNRLYQTVTKASKVNPNMNFEVFIHKVDGLTDENKMEIHRDISQQATDALSEGRIDSSNNFRLSFYLTSIYDHSIFEAFSKVVQKLIPQLPTLEHLLDNLISVCRIEKAFLIDVVSKIYVATDSSPVDMATYELCSDMIDVVIDISCIYGLKGDADGLAYDEKSQSLIRLSNGIVLYLREVNKYLALVCLLRDENLEKHGLIDYNFKVFRKGISDVFRKN